MDPILYVDRSEVRPGCLGPLKEAIGELAAFVERKEPRIASYSVYFSPDGQQMSITHLHPDAASLEAHMEVAGPLFPRFSQFIHLRSIDVYGRPSAAAVERLEKKAESLGGTVRIHEPHAGFTREAAG